MQKTEILFFYAQLFHHLRETGEISHTQGGAMNRTIHSFNRVYNNLHKITPLTIVAHIKIKRQRRNVHLNIVQ